LDASATTERRRWKGVGRSEGGEGGGVSERARHTEMDREMTER